MKQKEEEEKSPSELSSQKKNHMLNFLAKQKRIDKIIQIDPFFGFEPAYVDLA